MKLIKNTKIIKLFVITFLIAEDLGQKKKKMFLILTEIPKLSIYQKSK